MEYLRLSRENYNEAVSFLNYVFTLHNGAKLDCTKSIPSVFNPEGDAMKWHIACKDNGKICGMAGCYHMTYRIGETHLKVGAIENVAVDPEYRGKGIMQNIISRIFEEGKSENYDMFHLQGDRWRYRNFGFERCGAVYCFDFTRSMLGKEAPERKFTFEKLEDNMNLISEVFSLYGRNKAGILHNESNFFISMIAHERVPYIAFDENKKVAAFFCMDKAGTSFSNIVLENNDIFKDLLKCFIDFGKHKKVYMSLPLFHGLIDLAFSYSERYKIMQPGCFKIVNFKKVTETLMKEKCRYEYMPDGMITLDSDIFGKWSVKKEGNCIEVNPFEGEAQYTLSGFSVYSFLFGTNSPKCGSENDLLIKSWLPLPLYCQDFE